MRSQVMKKIVLALVLPVGVASTVSAQLHGMGRIQGRDGRGRRAAGRRDVKATLPGSTGRDTAKSDAKGQWILGGMAAATGT